MKVEGRLFSVVFVFLLIVTIVYWFLSYEPAGTTALALATLLSLLLGFYLTYTGRRIDPRPEDDSQADVADGAGEVGFFSPHSWWPITVAGAAAVTSLGGVFGWWLFGMGAILLLMAIMGFVFEYYRGDHSH